MMKTVQDVDNFEFFIMLFKDYLSPIFFNPSWIKRKETKKQANILFLC